MKREKHKTISTCLFPPVQRNPGSDSGNGKRDCLSFTNLSHSFAVCVHPKWQISSNIQRDTSSDSSGPRYRGSTSTFRQVLTVVSAQMMPNLINVWHIFELPNVDVSWHSGSPLTSVCLPPTFWRWLKTWGVFFGVNASRAACGCSTNAVCLSRCCLNLPSIPSPRESACSPALN